MTCWTRATCRSAWSERVDSLVWAFNAIADAGVRRVLVETARALTEADRERRAGR
ncbi:hypothetical protein JMJ56_07535 [Belnapia sp. T18]|uniref:Uncharacterized protein n=1 Tax=Belnapia arida TaxID=2804533 RepID=A0ABS1TZK8_9PROT|nr:hypothetical protein [Belnapia arida]MBL6077851.1 hypothetical protein [Belnapia arida]